MKIKAESLQTGLTIRVEYGDYGNNVAFLVDKVHVFANMVSVKVHSAGGIQGDFSWRPEEMVEVV